MGGSSHERRAGVLLLEDRKDRLNVQGVKCACIGQCRGLMANLLQVSNIIKDRIAGSWYAYIDPMQESVHT